MYKQHFVKTEISIHALREEGDRAHAPFLKKSTAFLSTPSARRATGRSPTAPHPTEDFYPRPPRGGRLRRLRAGRPHRNFYPRPPRGGRHKAAQALPAEHKISIHALREEGDILPVKVPPLLGIFLSTPSARRATKDMIAGRMRKPFLSPPSARRATRRLRQGDHSQMISIPALREEGDVESNSSKE